MMEKKEEIYKYNYDDYNLFHLIFNTDYKGIEQVEVVRKAAYQMDNDTSVRLPVKVAIAFADKIREYYPDRSKLPNPCPVCGLANDLCVCELVR